ncbi:MAG: cation:proton antiporter [Clostridiales bacterium]|nr:cation:proton antiporter [Clostridiales bacterium]
MEQLDYLIKDLALIFIVASIVTVLFKKLNQPVVLGYIVSGFLISPNFTYLPTVIESGDIHVWANIGVVFLMFALGLEFSFKKLATVGGSAFVTAVAVMGSMILIGAGIGSLLGWGKMDCIFLGGMLSMSSTMIILKAYEEYGLKQEKFAQLVLGTLVIEDIAGIFMMIILSTISVSQSVSGLAVFQELGILFIELAIWLLLGIYLIPSLLKKIRLLANDEMMLVVSVGICMGMVVIANLIGFSSALGAFMAGSILAGTVQSVRIERIITPIKDLFGAIFFVAVGMMIDPPLLIEYIGPILLITVVTILGQMTFATIGILLSGQSLHTAVRGGFSMVQIGEFSFIVATLGMSLSVISDFLYPIVVCVSVITSFTTPIFINNSEKVYRFLDRKLPSGFKIFLRKNTSERQSDDDKDRDWLLYIRMVLVRTGISSAAMFVIFLMGTKYLEPFLDGLIESDVTGRLLSAAVIIGMMIPFAAIMNGSVNDALMTKLWLKHRANRLPLLTLKGMRIMLSACFIALVLRNIFHIPFGLIVIIAAVPIAMIVHSDYMKGKTIDLEMRFLSNFSEKTLAKAKKERGIKGNYVWLNESLLVAEFQVTDASEHRTIYEFSSSRAFQVEIIKIIRGDKRINMPKADEMVLAGDILHMMGTHDEIESCMMLLEREDCIEYTDRPDVSLKDYLYAQTFHGIEPEQQLICCPIRIESDSEFLRKSIKNSGIRSRYRGTVIGIERDNLPIPNPDIETIIQKGDMIWVLGSQRMAEALIKGGVLKHK